MNGGALRRRFLLRGRGLEKRGGHDDKRHDDEGADNFRAVHEAVVGVEMRVRLLIEITCIHDVCVPRWSLDH